MTINVEETINNITEPTTAILTTMTEVKLNKKDKTKEFTNDLPTIFKLQKIQAELNVNYEDRMNKILLESGQEPTFKSEGMPWGESIDDKWVIHKEQKYLKVINGVSSDEPNYVFKNDEGQLEEIEYEVFEKFLPASKPKSDSTEPKVNFKVYQLSSIIGIELL